MSKATLLAVMGLCVTAAVAEPLKIIGYETGSGITFEGATVSNYYTIEFAMSPGGPWTNWGSITEQPITGAVMSAPSPFFYRIKQTDSSNFPPYATAGHTHNDIAASMIVSNSVVKSLNGLRDDVAILAGANVVVVPSTNSIRISAIVSASVQDTGPIPRMHIYDIDGTFTVPEGVTRVMVEVWGGGGGGGTGIMPTDYPTGGFYGGGVNAPLRLLPVM